MTSFELPDMTAPELEKFLDDNGTALGLSHCDRVSLRIRRRRRSIARHLATTSGGPGDLASELVAPSVAKLPHFHASSVCRVAVLGDDTQGKLELAVFLASAPAADARSTALAKLCSPQLLDVRLGRVAAAPRGDGTGPQSDDQRLVEVYVPPTSAAAVNLRLELLQHCDVVVVVYSIREASSLGAVESMWHDELDAALHLNRREDSGGYAAAGATGAADDAAVLTAPPAVILVGMDAEARQPHSHHRSGGAQSSDRRPATSSQDGIAAAQTLHASKYVEVHTGNAGHYKAVWAQVLAIAQQRHTKTSDADSSVERQRLLLADAAPAAGLCVLRGLPLYEHLRAEPPTLRLDAAAHIVHIALPKPSSSDAAHGLLTAAVGDDGGQQFPSGQLEAQFAYAFDPPTNEAGSDSDEAAYPAATHNHRQHHHHRPRKSACLPWLQTCAKRAPSNGVLVLPSPSLPQRLCVVAVVRGMFSSDEAWLDFPREGTLPEGYVNVATRTFCVSAGDDDDEGMASSKAKGPSRHHRKGADARSHSLRSVEATATAPFNIRYTLDGSEPTVHSHRYLGPVSLCGDDGATASEVYTPWPAYQGSPPRVVKYASFAHDAFPSATGTLVVPAVLDAPHASFSQTDRTLRVEHMLPNAVYRYTLDGTMPSYTNGLEYTRPVMLPQRAAGDGAHPVLRIVALPRLAFPSREVVLPLAASDATPATTPTTSSGGAPLRLSSLATTERPAVASPASGRNHSTNNHTAVGGSRSASTTAVAAATGGGSQNVFAMTRTAAARAELTHARRIEQQRSEAEPAMMVAPGSRGASPMVNSRGSTPDRLGLRGHSPAQKERYRTNESPRKAFTPNMGRRDSPHRASTHHRIDAQQTPPRVHTTHQAASDSRGGHASNGYTASNAVQRRSSSGDDRDQHHQRTQQSSSTGPAAGVGCVADENVVEFDFPEPIALSHLTVTTPGSGQGPASYEVFVVLMDTETWMGVGSGELDDCEAVQTMAVVPSARAVGVKRVRCVFGGPSTRADGMDDGVGRRPKAFVVRDMKIHGKPFRR